LDHDPPILSGQCWEEWFAPLYPVFSY
jgi:hypothetical protein